MFAIEFKSYKKANIVQTTDYNNYDILIHRNYENEFLDKPQECLLTD